MADEKRPRIPEETKEELRQDPFVERLRRDPSQPAQPVRVLEGLLGDSDRAGYRRLYFSRELDSYAEFRSEDQVYREPIPADQDPFRGLDASRVSIRRDAPVWYTQIRAPRPVDEFDLDIRLGSGGGWSALGAAPPKPFTDGCPYTFTCPPATYEPGECGNPTMYGCNQTGGCGQTHRLDTCYGPWCNTNKCPTELPTQCQTCNTQCNTLCGQATCQTCQTKCNQNTCVHTQCGQQTCQTCHTRCGQQTCQTCHTKCGQQTCGQTCDICPTEAGPCLTKVNTCNC